MSVREFLDAVKARAEAATPGPWEIVREHHTCYIPDGLDCYYPDSPITERDRYEVAEGYREDADWHRHESYDAHDISPKVAGNYEYDAGGIIETVDAEFIAAARTDVPRLVAALEAVLEMHQETVAFPGGIQATVCRECHHVSQFGVAGQWPCSTVQAIENVLGGSDVD